MFEWKAINSDKKEFVTVGEGESAHAIPVDYLKKDKEEKKAPSYKEIDKLHTDLMNLKHKWRKGGLEGATLDFDETLSDEVFKKSEEFEKIFSQYEKKQKKYELPKSEILDGREKLKIKDQNGKVTPSRLEKLGLFPRRRTSFEFGYDLGEDTEGRKYTLSIDNPKIRGARKEARIYMGDIRRAKDYHNTIISMQYDDFRTENFNEIVDYLADKKLLKEQKASNAILLDDNVGGKGKVFQSRFLQAGLVKYSFGVCLLENEVINKFVHNFVGCPVIINHKDVTTETAKDDRVGVISDVWFNEYDGWFYCKGVIFEQEALDLIDQNYSISCQYEITEYSENRENKLHNGNPYDKTILNGKPEHLAIVKNPRYEMATIAVNAMEVDEMGLEAKNGWITRKTGNYRIDEKGEEHAEVQHIWIEGSIQPSEWKKWNKNIFDNFKKGDETKFEFNRTRTKISEEHQNLIKNTLKDFNSKYNFNTVASINVMGLSEGSLGLCASRTNASTVTLSPALFNGKYTQKDYDKSVKGGFHPKGTGDMIKSVLVHELGHSITVFNDKNNEFWSEINTIRNDYMKNIKKTDVENPDFISNYARVNKKEFVAEAFCQGVLSKKSGKYTKKVMDIIDKFYSKNNQLKLALNAKDEDENNNNNDKEWVEEFGGGYPIDEEAYEKMKKQSKPPINKDKAKNDIIQAINEIKENPMFKKLFKKEEKMDKDEMKSIFMECLTELTAANKAEEEVKEEVKEEVAENKCKNEEPDYKKLYEDLKAECEKAKNEEEKAKEEENAKAKNSILAGSDVKAPIFITEKRARELGKELF